MLTTQAIKTGSENIARTSRTVEVPHRIIGIVNFAGYQIVDVSAKKILKTLGNNPTTSNPKYSLPEKEGLDVNTMKMWCELEGRAIAAEQGANWRGVREGEFK